MKITFIIGLPCSGKSTLCKSLNGIIIDDPKDFEDIKRKLSETEINYISDCNLVDDYILVNAEVTFLINYKNIEFDYIYFENAPEKCLINYKKRSNNGDDRKVEEFIKYYSTIYKPPEKSIKIIN